MPLKACAASSWSHARCSPALSDRAAAGARSAELSPASGPSTRCGATPTRSTGANAIPRSLPTGPRHARPPAKRVFFGPRGTVLRWEGDALAEEPPLRPRSRSSGSVPAMPPRSPIRTAFLPATRATRNGAGRRSSSWSTVSPLATAASAATWMRGRSQIRRLRSRADAARGRAAPPQSPPPMRAAPVRCRRDRGGGQADVLAEGARALGAQRRRRFPPAHSSLRGSLASTDAPAPGWCRTPSGTRSVRPASPARAARRSARRAPASRGRRAAGPGRGDAYGCWDSCLLEGFQREASGHHPAPHPGRPRAPLLVPRALARLRARVRTSRLRRRGRFDVTCPGSIGALRVLGGTR